MYVSAAARGWPLTPAKSRPPLARRETGELLRSMSWSTGFAMFGSKPRFMRL